MKVEKELQELGFQPSAGQNFLNSEAVIKALVSAGEVDGKKVLEIGPGTGNVTERLAKDADKVYAVEKDTFLADHLDQKFSESGKVEILNQDILDYDWPPVERCVANLPFEITSEIIEKLGREQLQSAVIVQKELAEKVTAEPGSPEYTYFTLLVNYFFVPVKLRDISPENYYPAPEVDTSILKLYPNKERHSIEKEENFLKVSKALFTHKGKKLRNAFVDARNILDISKEKAKSLRDEIPHSEERVREMDVRKLGEASDYLDGKI